MKLIVGLGNPGARYQHTRHNVGFLVIERLAVQHSISIGQDRCDALVGQGIVEMNDVVLAKPQTFMNHSGFAVACLLREHNLSVGDLVVITDDLDLPFGRLRLRPSGSAGGHRGLVSISEALSGEQFVRVRVGIGRPPVGSAVIDYVLDEFSDGELEGLGEIIERAGDAVLCLLRDGVERAMGSYNRA